MTKPEFYHTGCPECVSTEHELIMFMDSLWIDTDVVFVREQKNRISETEIFEMKPVPTLIADKRAFHINFDTSMEEVNNG